MNLDAVRAISRDVPGSRSSRGGLRSLPDIEKVLALGVRYVVLDCAAVERLGLVEQACQKFPGQVRTGIDARNGEWKIAGWLEGTGLSAVDVAQGEGGRRPARRVHRRRADGMFTGVDAEGAARIQAEAGILVAASGGVASLADVEVQAAAGLAGVIVVLRSTSAALTRCCDRRGARLGTSMPAKRIIPRLDVKGGRVVKGINFKNLRDAGDPVEAAQRYDAQGADEVTYLDIAATQENRTPSTS